MATKAYNIHAAKTRFSNLVARAEKGERIPIARAGKVVAHLVPATKRNGARKLQPGDPLLDLDNWAFEGPVGKLTNEEIDRIVYGI